MAKVKTVTLVCSDRHFKAGNSISYFNFLNVLEFSVFCEAKVMTCKTEILHARQETD